MRYLVVTLAIYILFICPLFSQEQIGLRMDNFSGVNGLMINPTQSLTSPFRWDLNLFSIGANAQSNYGYFNKTNVFEVLRNRETIIAQRDIESGGIPPPNSVIAVAANTDGDKYFSTFGFGTGPSLMLNFESGHSVGLFTNARFGFSIHDIPDAVDFDRFYDTPYFQFVDIEPFKMAGIGWAELGLNYAYKFPTYNGYMGVGVNVKFLRGYEAFFLKTNGVNPTSQIPSDTLIFGSLNLDYGLTTSNLSAIDNEDLGSANLTSNGGGFGIDIGFSYIFEGDEDNYKWKLGASLLDIGNINFTKNAESHQIRNDTIQIFAQDKYKEASIADAIKLLSFETYADSSASLKSRNLKIALPTALSVQFDYMVMPNIYVNGLLVQRIAFGNSAALRRNNLIAITPRFEHRWYGGGLSLSVLNYKQMAVGLSARLAFLTIGSDDIGSFFGKNNLNSTDFYVGLKINPFDMGLNIGGGGGRRGKNVKCYEF